MSFSTDLKNEILENRYMRARYKKARAYGLFAFSKSFSAAAVELATENPETAKLFTWFLRDILGRCVKITEKQRTQNGKIVHIVKLDELGDRQGLLRFFGCKSESLDSIDADNLPTDGDVCAFLSGAYLACGNITNPEKSYHIEYVVRKESLCDGLFSILDSCLPGAKRTTRRTSHVIYYKEYAQIEDLLTLMGASKSCLAMIDIEMIKGVRNSANRATNCETANIDKLVEAAAGQIEDIRLVLETAGEEHLPEGLRSAAHLRLENPDASLRELAAMHKPAISRSGMNHRLQRLSAMANEIRKDNKRK